MIPNKLSLCNFMCYRTEQTVDFTGIHLACLAGDNGHGKSTLLDAMTWALWGKARARRDDELIYLGESEMWVDFEFGMGGQRYRVWRQRSRKGRGQSELHFYVWNEAGGDWQLLDDGNLLERQAQIIRTLRLEYETFVNSAFLLQGHADSFTVKTPSERKQILAEILGLSRYDQYEERAKEAARSRKTAAERLEGEMAAIDRDLARRDEYDKQLAEARADALSAVTDLRAAEAVEGQARLALQGLSAQKQQLADLDNRLARAERDLADGGRQLADAQNRLAQLEAVVAHRVEIEAGWAALQAARQQDASWNERLLRHTRLQAEMNQVQQTVDRARLALEGEVQRIADRRKELEQQLARGEQSAATVAQVREILASLDEQQLRRDAIAAELREIAEQITVRTHRGDSLGEEGKVTKERITALDSAEIASCPLCGQPLSGEHRAQMLDDLRARRDDLAAQFQANRAEGKLLAERKAALEEEDANLARKLRDRDPRLSQLARAETLVADAEAAAEELGRVNEQAAMLAQRLDAADYAHAEQASLRLLHEQLAYVGYDSAAHQATRAQVESHGLFDARYQRELLPALDGLADARTRADSLAEQQVRREQELAADHARRATLLAALADLPRLEEELRNAAATVEAAAAVERTARQREGAAIQQINALSALTERRKQCERELDTVNAEIAIYNQLREAFGKKGLQAMIIEGVIPEVEAEANTLLSRMSEGRMSLRLETQREKVTGGTAETLDIIIADELGSRAYELFSGGEAFRANLALRIAISKLLARRAGAQLQTLVIDEGFGTQDAQGRTLLVEAISSIQHDFERVIVITHIEELKDLFPARIDVVKTASGSRIMVA